ncbi:MAG: hypothetical protein C0498_13005 [Anaerolinea sp.]|nr:hypothetical protein [Anaerolinea sp.]
MRPMRPTESPDFPYIKAGLSDDADDECIEIQIMGPGEYRKAHLKLHTTEAIDLHKKLSNALCDWIAESAVAFVTGKP